MIGWRDVPYDNSMIGDTAKGTEPHVVQVFVENSTGRTNWDFERELYRVRKVQFILFFIFLYSTVLCIVSFFLQLVDGAVKYASSILEWSLRFSSRRSRSLRLCLVQSERRNRSTDCVSLGFEILRASVSYFVGVRREFPRLFLFVACPFLVALFSFCFPGARVPALPDSYLLLFSFFCLLQAATKEADSVPVLTVSDTQSFYVCSLSSRTIVYKGQLSPEQVRCFTHVPCVMLGAVVGLVERPTSRKFTFCVHEKKQKQKKTRLIMRGSFVTSIPF